MKILYTTEPRAQCHLPSFDSRVSQTGFLSRVCARKHSTCEFAFSLEPILSRTRRQISCARRLISSLLAEFPVKDSFCAIWTELAWDSVRSFPLGFDDILISFFRVTGSELRHDSGVTRNPAHSKRPHP
jgi:hypothetical protein